MKFEIEISDNLIAIMKAKQHKEHWTNRVFLLAELEKLMANPVWFEELEGKIDVNDVK